MPLDLSLSNTIEKNKLMSDSVWLILMEITFKDTTIHLVNNTEEITWNSNIWQPFPFELDNLEEDSKGTIPTLSIKVGNQAGQLQKYLRAVSGGIGCTAIIRVVNSKYLNITESDLELDFIVEEVECNSNWVTFTLGGGSSNATRYPRWRVIKDFCPFAFKGIMCGYSGSATSCSKTLKSCRNLGNDKRFGGEYSLPNYGLYASNS